MIKSYNELKSDLEAIQKRIAESKKNKCIGALKEVKIFCKEFVFTIWMLKGSIAEVFKKQ